MDKTLRQYQIDAFASRVFEGNPAAVVPLDEWLADTTMQAIAAENNLSETAFLLRAGEAYHLRWFSPAGEIDLCGHATLASAYVLFELLGYSGKTIAFDTRSGRLVVEREGQRLTMDFPTLPAYSYPAPAALLAGLKRQPLEVLAADDYFAVYESEDDIRTLIPDVAELAKLDRRGVCITAPGKSVDFVSRFFGPKWGIPEDPVTGSAHCSLAPYDRHGWRKCRKRRSGFLPGHHASANRASSPANSRAAAANFTVNCVAHAYRFPDTR